MENSKKNVMKIRTGDSTKSIEKFMLTHTSQYENLLPFSLPQIRTQEYVSFKFI